MVFVEEYLGLFTQVGYKILRTLWKLGLFEISELFYSFWSLFFLKFVVALRFVEFDRCVWGRVSEAAYEAVNILWRLGCTRMLWRSRGLDICWRSWSWVEMTFNYLCMPFSYFGLPKFALKLVVCIWGLWRCRAEARCRRLWSRRWWCLIRRLRSLLEVLVGKRRWWCSIRRLRS